MGPRPQAMTQSTAGRRARIWCAISHTGSGAGSRDCSSSPTVAGGRGGGEAGAREQARGGGVGDDGDVALGHFMSHLSYMTNYVINYKSDVKCQPAYRVPNSRSPASPSPGRM